MNREEWKTLYREARTLLRDEVPPTDGGAQKDTLYLKHPDGAMKAVIKTVGKQASRGHERHPIDGDRDCEHFATFAEEAILYRFLPHEARPWTVWMRGGTVQLQEPVFHARGGEDVINRCKDAGFSDIADFHNTGFTRDDRCVVFDWGVTQLDGSNTRLRDMLVRKRRIARLKGEEYAYA